MFEPAVDRLGGSVGGAGSVEVGQHVRGPLLQGPAEPSQLGQRGRDVVAEVVDDRRASAGCPAVRSGWR